MTTLSSRCASDLNGQGELPRCEESGEPGRGESFLFPRSRPLATFRSHDGHHRVQRHLTPACLSEGIRSRMIRRLVTSSPSSARKLTVSLPSAVETMRRSPRSASRSCAAKCSTPPRCAPRPRAARCSTTSHRAPRGGWPTQPSSRPPSAELRREDRDRCPWRGTTGPHQCSAMHDRPRDRRRRLHLDFAADIAIARATGEWIALCSGRRRPMPTYLSLRSSCP